MSIYPALDKISERLEARWMAYGTQADRSPLAVERDLWILGRDEMKAWLVERGGIPVPYVSAGTSESNYLLRGIAIIQAQDCGNGK